MKFEDWLIDAVIKDFKLSETQDNEDNWSRAYKMMGSFIEEQPWESVVKHYDKMSKLTKQDIMAYAGSLLDQNYVAVNKRKGEKNAYKVEKPEITPIQLDRDNKSEFLTEFEQMPETRLKPVFLDYEKQIAKSSLNSDVPFSYIENTTNETFSLYYILEMGTDHDKQMALAIDYLAYLGTEKYTAEQLQQEFYKLGVRFDVFNNRERCYVTLSGLEESLEQGVALFEEILSTVVADEEAYQKMVAGIMKKRSDAKLSKYSILNRALLSYGMYGSDSPQKNIFSAEELQSMKPEDLVGKIKEIGNYKHQVFYYGKKNQDEVKGVLNKYHKSPETLADLPAPKEYTREDMNGNKVLFVHHDMVQVEMMMVSKAQQFDPSLITEINLFNQYFGSGLSSIVFQEIRESKALAYSAYSYFTVPGKQEDPHYVRAYVGTQADKLEDAAKAMTELMNNMPEAESQFEDSKLAAQKKIETERISKTSIFWNYMGAQRRGYDHDMRKDIYEGMNDVDMAGLKKFFDENIKGRNYTILVMGNRDMVKKEVLETMGPVTEVTLEEIFGY